MEILWVQFYSGGDDWWDKSGREVTDDGNEDRKGTVILSLRLPDKYGVTK